MIPLLVKEFRTWARRWEIRATCIIYILALSLLTFSLIWSASTGKAITSPEHGRGYMLSAFVVVLSISLYMICPAFAMNSISLEREQPTFEQIRMTLLKSREILLGKAIPTLAFILLLLFASLPMVILIVPLAGASKWDITRCYLVIFISTAGFSFTGLACSAICKRPRTAIIAGYVITGYFTFGTLLLHKILKEIFRLKLNHVLSDLFMFINPFHTMLNSLGRGRQFQLVGLPSWFLAISGYLIISVIAFSIALAGINRARN